MIYQPKKVAEMWDTWLYQYEGTHYLYYLHKSEGDRWDGMSVATSKDGVHYEEVGPIVSKRDDATWLGTGSVWKAGDRFVLNFSESREGVQAIFFADSEDLIHWTRLGDELRSDPDPRWYDDTKTGRWDCIWTIAKPDGSGLYGYLTARPWSTTAGVSFESIGMLESNDGIQWHALPPPRFEWGEWPQLNLFCDQVGAVEKIGTRYYLLLTMQECLLGNRWLWEEMSSERGMKCFVSERPEGPFSPVTGGFRLPISRPNGTWFARFYPTQRSMLVNHHAMETAGGGSLIWMAPLKKAVVDDGGHLRLGYWSGNDALRGDAVAVDLSRATRLYPALDAGTWNATAGRLEVDEPMAGGVTLLDVSFDPLQGVVLEGGLTIQPSHRPWAGVGLLVETNATGHGGTGLLMQTRGRTEIGQIDNPSRGSFAPTHRFDLGVEDGRRHAVRLLLRRTMIELYVDDILVLCHSLEQMPTGRLGLIHEAGRALFEDLRIWRMSDRL